MSWRRSSLHPLFVMFAFLSCFCGVLQRASAENVKNGKRIVIEDFESYASDQTLAKAWYKPPHGAPLKQTLEKETVAEGRQGLKLLYQTNAEPTTNYSAICRVAKWDLSGCDAIQLWVKPDGSGHHFTIQLNIADAKGKNIHDLWQVTHYFERGDVSPRLLTMPFSALEHNIKYADSPDTSPIFEPADLIEVAFYVGAKRGQHGEGAYYIDQIEGVRLAEVMTAPELVDILPVTENILALHFDEGFVEHHRHGTPRSDERVFVAPLDLESATTSNTYSIASPDDAAYAKLQHPSSIGRKSKGTDFAWFIDRWENGRTVNSRPDHTKEHWVYLELPQPLQRGKSYELTTGNMASNGRRWTIRFDDRELRSEAIHVNSVGYVPNSPQKFAYAFAWLGDRGPLDLRPFEGRSFQLIEESTGETFFTGKLKFRKSATDQETFHKSDSPPDGNFLRADVFECDFSTFTRPGWYRISIDGIGSSYTFPIGPDVYRPAYREVARGLYHNRSGIALERPFTEFTRPAPHNPRQTPGFAGKLIYSSTPFTEWGSEGGDSKALLKNAKGPIESAGWYQDAGDWDSYESHLRVAQELLLAFEIAPTNFKDSELNIPESGNGVPDILDEAAWLPRFCQRLRKELLEKGYGTGGIGLRIAGDAFGNDEKQLPDGTLVGQGSWEDVNRTWVVSGEDPWSTYRYAGTAAQLAYCLRLAGVSDPEGIDWTAEARASYDWAQSHTRSTEATDPTLRSHRCYASAALLRLTGDKKFEEQFTRDTSDINKDSEISDDRFYGAAIYALSDENVSADNQKRIQEAVLHTADQLLAVAERRGLRWAGNWSMPMLIGQQTTPLALPLAVAHVVAKRHGYPTSERYLGALCTTADYFLGGNALNMTWVTGLGPRYPRQIFHMDAWYNGKGSFHPGLIPYGPWRKERDLGAGPWDTAWPHSTVYPAIDHWPGNERWFDNRCSPMNSEFTIHQNNAPAAAIYGVLSGPSLFETEKRR